MSVTDHANKTIYKLEVQPAQCPKCHSHLADEPVKSGFKLGKWKNFCPSHGAIYYDIKNEQTNP